jgi:hypothetical protein
MPLEEYLFSLAYSTSRLCSVFLALIQLAQLASETPSNSLNITYPLAQGQTQRIELVQGKYQHILFLGDQACRQQFNKAIGTFCQYQDIG